MKKSIIMLSVLLLLMLTACQKGTIPEYSKEELDKQFTVYYYGDVTVEQLEELVEENLTYYPESSYWEVVNKYRASVRGESEVIGRLYPLFYTDMKYYTEEDFENVPEEILILARNEIYARHGYIFEDNQINNYFMGCEWYQPLYSKDVFDDKLLNEYEWDNLELISEIENR